MGKPEEEEQQELVADEQVQNRTRTAETRQREQKGAKLRAMQQVPARSGRMIERQAQYRPPGCLPSLVLVFITSPAD